MQSKKLKNKTKQNSEFFMFNVSGIVKYKLLHGISTQRCQDNLQSVCWWPIPDLGLEVRDEDKHPKGNEDHPGQVTKARHFLPCLSALLPFSNRM